MENIKEKVVKKNKKENKKAKTIKKPRNKDKKSEEKIKTQDNKKRTKETPKKTERKKVSKKTKKKGNEWIKTGNHSYKCPYCNMEQIIMFPVQRMFKYCPDCGKEVKNKEMKIIRI